MAHAESALRNAAELAAWSVAAVCVTLLLLALAAELLRRAHAGAPVVAAADRLLPTPSRRVAVALLTLLSTAAAIALPPGARADDHVRSWLVDDAGRAAVTATTTSTTTAERSPVADTAPTTTTTSTTSPSAPEAVGALAPSPPVAPPRPTAVLRTVAPAPLAKPPAPAPVATTSTGPTYTVVPGDCLWSIAARILGRNASARAIDRAWRAIYAANRVAVGSDPNLIHPGLVLTLPPLDPTP
jgi:nucleoid-associated protein YgaU